MKVIYHNKNSIRQPESPEKLQTALNGWKFSAEMALWMADAELK